MRTSDGQVIKLCERFDNPGHAHELTFTCYQNLPLLGKDRSRQWFVDALMLARRKHAFEIWAYVIMPDHAHLLIFPRSEDYSIAAILKTIKQSVSRHAMIYLRAEAPEWLERLKVTWPNGRVEHRFWQQGGGYDRNMWAIDAIWNSIRYLHANPFARGWWRRQPIGSGRAPDATTVLRMYHLWWNIHLASEARTGKRVRLPMPPMPPRWQRY